MTESFSRGFDHGNYGNAYESQDWEVFSEDMEPPEGLDPEEYREGAMLGFFSTYEIDEIPYEYQDEVAHLRAKHGED